MLDGACVSPILAKNLRNDVNINTIESCYLLQVFVKTKVKLKRYVVERKRRRNEFYRRCEAESYKLL